MARGVTSNSCASSLIENSARSVSMLGCALILATMSSIQYPWPATPAPGQTIEVAPGIHWLSMPLPFALNHINLWLVAEDDGWIVVDTGIGNAETRALWDKLLARFSPVKRVILTHYHPDH